MTLGDSSPLGKNTIARVTPNLKNNDILSLEFGGGSWGVLFLVWGFGGIPQYIKFRTNGTNWIKLSSSFLSERVNSTGGLVLMTNLL